MADNFDEFDDDRDEVEAAEEDALYLAEEVNTDDEGDDDAELASASSTLDEEEDVEDADEDGNEPGFISEEERARSLMVDMPNPHGSIIEARRSEAGAPPHPVRHERVRLHAEQAAHEVGPYRRRRDRQVPSPWRLRRVRHHGAPGPALQPAPASHRWPRQLRLHRWRLRRCHALHRGAPRQAGHGTSARPGQGDGRLPAQLRRVAAGAYGAAVALPEPAGQRLERHRRRHGHQHPAPQPGRGHRRHLPHDR